MLMCPNKYGQTRQQNEKQDHEKNRSRLTQREENSATQWEINEKVSKGGEKCAGRESFLWSKERKR